MRGEQYLLKAKNGCAIGKPNFKLLPGTSAKHTFNKPGEYFYNDCHSPRSTGKIVVY